MGDFEIIVFWGVVILLILFMLTTTNSLGRFFKNMYNRLVQALKWQPHEKIIRGEEPSKKKHQTLPGDEEPEGASTEQGKIYQHSKRDS